MIYDFYLLGEIFDDVKQSIRVECSGLLNKSLMILLLKGDK